MPELHPSGTFNDAEIIDHGFDKSSKKLTPYFWTIFKTEQGQVRGTFWLTEKSAEHTMTRIRDMGYEGDHLAGLADGTALVGKLVQITVEHDENDGKTYANVGFVNANNAIMGPTHDESVAASMSAFDALWRKKRGNVESMNDDDVPF